MKVILPILFRTDAIQSLVDNNLDYDIKDCIVNNMIFYNITSIGPYLINDKPSSYTLIYADGEMFICKLHLLKVEELIDASRKQDKI